MHILNSNIDFNAPFVKVVDRTVTVDLALTMVVFKERSFTTFLYVLGSITKSLVSSNVSSNIKAIEGRFISWNKKKCKMLLSHF